MLLAYDTGGLNAVASGSCRGSAFFCPHCGQAVRLRAGVALTAHFAHLPGSFPCPDAPASGHYRPATTRTPAAGVEDAPVDDQLELFPGFAT